MYSSMSTITLECNHDYLNDFYVSLSSVLTDYCYPLGVIIINNNQTTFSGIE